MFLQLALNVCQPCKDARTARVEVKQYMLGASLLHLSLIGVFL